MSGELSVEVEFSGAEADSLESGRRRDQDWATYVHGLALVGLLASKVLDDVLADELVNVAAQILRDRA